MAKSKNDFIHKWKLNGEVMHHGARFFLYKCTRCPVEVRNGQPFSEVGGMECTK